MLVYWKIDEVSWAALTLTFLIVPAVIMQVTPNYWFELRNNNHNRENHKNIFPSDFQRKVV